MRVDRARVSSISYQTLSISYRLILNSITLIQKLMTIANLMQQKNGARVWRSNREASTRDMSKRNNAGGHQFATGCSESTSPSMRER
jgi:hypothetical protein